MYLDFGRLDEYTPACMIQTFVLHKIDAYLHIYMGQELNN